MCGWWLCPLHHHAFHCQGSLLAYIRKEKINLVVPKEADDELASSLIPRHPSKEVWQIYYILRGGTKILYYIHQTLLSSCSVEGGSGDKTIAGRLIYI